MALGQLLPPALRASSTTAAVPAAPSLAPTKSGRLDLGVVVGADHDRRARAGQGADDVPQASGHVLERAVRQLGRRAARPACATPASRPAAGRARPAPRSARTRDRSRSGLPARRMPGRPRRRQTAAGGEDQRSRHEPPAQRRRPRRGAALGRALVRLGLAWASARLRFALIGGTAGSSWRPQRSQITSASDTPCASAIGLRPRAHGSAASGRSSHRARSSSSSAPSSAGPRCSSERSTALTTSSCLSLRRTTHIGWPEPRRACGQKGEIPAQALVCDVPGRGMRKAPAGRRS